MISITDISHNHFYSPSSIISILNASLSIKEEKKIIQVRGIYKKSGTTNYGGFFYDKIKDEASDFQITLVTPAIIHNKLEDNKTIEFNAFITRKITKQGQIDININLIDIISQTANKFSEEDIKKLSILNKKVEQGNKDLDTAIKNAIFHNHTLNIGIILGKSAIIHHDIQKGMGEAIALYNISYHPTNLTSPNEISNMIEALDNQEFDVICIARGGGDNLSVFDNPDLAEKALGRNAIIASAIGHDIDVTLFEKIADKKFSLPFHFGTYLKEIFNETIHDYESSRAKLAKDIEFRLNTEYSKKFETLNQQLITIKQLNEKTTVDKDELHKQEITTLRNQINNLELSSSQKEEMIKQANNLADNYRKQAEESKAKPGISLALTILLIALGVIIGLLISNINQ